MPDWNIPLHIEKALERVAQDEALLSREERAYLPKTSEEAASFNPHDWVRQAMRRAFAMGRVAGRAAAQEEIRNALGLRA